MVDADKKVFWSMINITMELCNRPALSKEAIVGYWQSLSKFELETVRVALDAWVDGSSKAPTPHDIKELCKPKDEVFKALPRPNSREKNKAYADNVVEFVNKNSGGGRDNKAWARKILANPKMYPDISVKFANEELKSDGHAR